jgi:hypothetical protein
LRLVRVLLPESSWNIALRALARAPNLKEINTSPSRIATKISGYDNGRVLPCCVMLCAKLECRNFWRDIDA